MVLSLPRNPRGMPGSGLRLRGRLFRGPSTARPSWERQAADAAPGSRSGHARGEQSLCGLWVPIRGADGLTRFQSGSRGAAVEPSLGSLSACAGSSLEGRPGQVASLYRPRRVPSESTSSQASECGRFESRVLADVVSEGAATGEQAGPSSVPGIRVREEGRRASDTQGEGRQRTGQSAQGCACGLADAKGLGQTLEAGERPGAGSPAIPKGTSPAPRPRTFGLQRERTKVVGRRLSLWHFGRPLWAAVTPPLGSVWGRPEPAAPWPTDLCAASPHPPLRSVRPDLGRAISAGPVGALGWCAGNPVGRRGRWSQCTHRRGGGLSLDPVLGLDSDRWVTCGASMNGEASSMSGREHRDGQSPGGSDGVWQNSLTTPWTG